jgi:CheY-like chemotaxis protein
MSSDKFHFIVIDDSKLDCFIAEKVIQNSGRSESVKSFMVATEALDYIKTLNGSDIKTVVLVDIQMPVMNGFEFIEAYEQNISDEAKNKFMVNLLSSSINETDMIRAKGYKSVNKFLNKPLTKATLDIILESA